MMCVFVLTTVVVLREHQADKRPTVAACRRDGAASAAPHLAQLLSQSYKSLTQNRTF